MWPFNRTIARSQTDWLAGFTDWHSHILPGVDDGVATMEEALAILRRYETLGVAEVWLTPHIMEDIPNTPSQLRARFAALQAAYEGPVRLRLGSENMLDNLFGQRLEAEELLPVGEDRLLVETSYFNPPMDLAETLRRIRSRGYIPLLAHPERYLYMGRDDYRQLRDEGVEFQLNRPALAGWYGRHVREKAAWLQRKGYYACAGSDLHSLKMLQQITTGMNEQEKI